ncbi:MAG: hypothetical protein U9R05_09370 [Chloroflexota bacterium]|nr:hypothetical protein [Chloroflexota bacterium]
MAVVWLIAGALVGWVSILIQVWTVARLCPRTPRRGLGLLIGGMLLRWALIAGLFSVALRQGIVAGLWAFAGLWVARWLGILRIHAGKSFAGPRA